MIGEIKAVARRHLETDGSNLSLRAVARDMGMVSSALYRYFASRDELLTALILDAYNDLGATVEAADAAVTDRANLRGRWLCGRARCPRLGAALSQPSMPCSSAARCPDTQRRRTPSRPPRGRRWCSSGFWPTAMPPEC